MADWFESRPISPREESRQAEAMDLFTRAESQLRDAGTAVLRRHRSRDLVLQAAGVPPRPRDASACPGKEAPRR